MLIMLLIILISLILFVCGDKGAKSIVTSAASFVMLLGGIYLMYRGVDPLIVTFAISILASSLILFYQNEVNIKSKIAMASVIIVFLLLLPLVYFVSSGAGSQGFTTENYEITDSNGYSRNIDINMLYIQISVMIISLVGTVVDAAVAITTSIYEIKQSIPNISKHELIKSGITVGGSILCTSMHTIFYIYIAEYLTLMMQYVQDYSFVQMINSESFSQEFLSITISGLGICLVIPVAAFLSVYLRDRQKNNKDLQL